MISIRFHGRGGQGVVTSSEVLAVAAEHDEKFGQAMPAFGPERTLAPVMSFCRIDDKRIQIYQEVYNPNIVVVLDSSLLGTVDALKGLEKNGVLIINSKEFDIKYAGGKVYFVDALPIAKRIIGKPFVNTVILGALAKITGVVSLDSLKKAIIHRFPGENGQKNAVAAEECYNSVKL